MKIDILTLFPELFQPFKEWSMISKAQEINALEINFYNIRDWAVDKHGTVDDAPYGGGPGMVMRPEPIYNALQNLTRNTQTRNPETLRTILLSAKGETFNQDMAIDLSQKDHLILVCGHYEGVYERVRQHMVDLDISIGNYVLSGGEIPAMAVTDAVSRLLPGVLEKEGASEEESFSPGLKDLAGNSEFHNSKITNHKSLIEYPHYTRPAEFKGWEVPEVLLSGNHKKIAQWRAAKITNKLEDND